MTFQQNDGRTREAAQKKSNPIEGAVTIILVIGALTFLAIAPAIVIGAWKFFL